MKRFLVVLFVAVLVCGAFLAGLFLPKLTGTDTEAPAPVEAEPEPAAPVPVVAVAPVFTPAKAPVLRVQGGVIEWFDGAAWYPYDKADTLTAADPVALAAQARLSALATEQPPAEDGAPHQRAAGQVQQPRTGGGGGGSSGGSDGQDIEWSGDQL